MSGRAKQLLLKMSTAIDNGEENSFDSDFYLDAPDFVVAELENAGFIRSMGNISGTIMLTDLGYQEATAS